MSYEYKEINRAIVQQNGIDNNINRGNLLREIDEVYALAEKLPEYEVKAESFDRIAKIYTLFKAKHISTLPTDDETLDFAIDISEIIDEYESGERNAKK